MLPESIGVMLQVIEVFKHLQIPYFVGGSIASAFYGVARSTLDADIVAEFHPDQIQALIRELENDFYMDDEMITEAISHHSSFNLIHLKTAFKVDVFILKERPFDQVQFDRRVELQIASDPTQRAFITTAEDIILAKLEWYRSGGEISDRQWQDILGVIKIQSGQLDLDYLQHWSAELKLTDLLERALKEGR